MHPGTDTSFPVFLALQPGAHFLPCFLCQTDSECVRCQDGRLARPDGVGRREVGRPSY